MSPTIAASGEAAWGSPKISLCDGSALYPPSAAKGHVDEANGVQSLANMIFSNTDVQFGKTPIWSHGDAGESPHLIKLQRFATSLKAFEPVDGQTRIAPAETELGTVNASIFTDLYWPYVANDMIAIGQLIADHAFTNDVRSKASI